VMCGSVECNLFSVIARRRGGTVLTHKVHKAAVSGTDLSWSPGATWAG
jgi:hypothetical protein